MKKIQQKIGVIDVIKIAKSFFEFLNFKRKYKNTKVLARRFGNNVKGFYSQDGQDAFVYTEFFEKINSDSFPKIIVDIGCNQPILFSNSYFFEKHVGFRCLAVDPITKYIAHWKEKRPTASLINVAVGDQEDEILLREYVSEQENNASSHPSDMFSTLVPAASKAGTSSYTTSKIKVVKTQDLFDQHQLTSIGIMSIDVEGFEEKVLRGIDFQKTSVCIAIIENNTKSKAGENSIREVMNSAGFAFYARLWGIDDIYINKKIISLDSKMC